MGTSLAYGVANLFAVNTLAAFCWHVTASAQDAAGDEWVLGTPAKGCQTPTEFLKDPTSVVRQVRRGGMFNQSPPSQSSPVCPCVLQPSLAEIEMKQTQQAAVYKSLKSFADMTTAAALASAAAGRGAISVGQYPSQSPGQGRDAWHAPTAASSSMSSPPSSKEDLHEASDRQRTHDDEVTRVNTHPEAPPPPARSAHVPSELESGLVTPAEAEQWRRRLAAARAAHSSGNTSEYRAALVAAHPAAHDRLHGLDSAPSSGGGRSGSATRILVRTPTADAAAAAASGAKASSAREAMSTSH